MGLVWWRSPLPGDRRSASSASSAVVFCLTLGLLAGRVSAQEPDARLLFEHGREAYAAGRYGEARDAWVAAYEASARPDLLYNIAQAYRGLGLSVQELDYLDRFVEAVPESHPVRATAVARADALRARISETRIVLTHVPADADVLLDGALVPGEGTRRALSTPPGPHQVVVARDGYLPFQAAVDASAGRETHVVVRMEERPVVRAHTVDAATMALWAGGSGLLAVGAVAGGVGFARADGVLATSRRAQRLQRVGFAADAMMAAGVVMGVVGLVRYLRSEGDVARDASRARLHVSGGPEGLSLGVAGDF